MTQVHMYRESTLLLPTHSSLVIEALIMLHLVASLRSQQKQT
jgi:hypothetical protein